MPLFHVSEVDFVGDMRRNRFVICLNGFFWRNLVTTGKEALGAVRKAETNFPALATGAFFLQRSSKVHTFSSNLHFILVEVLT